MIILGRVRFVNRGGIVMSIRYILTLLLPYFACINGAQIPDLMVTGTESRSFEQYILAQLAAPTDVMQACSGWLNTNRDLIDCALGYELMVGSVKPLMDVTHEVLARKNLKNLSNFNYVFRIPQTQWVMKIAGHVNRKHNLNTLYHYVRYPENPFGEEHYQYGRALQSDDYILFDQKLADHAFDHAMQGGMIVLMRQAPKTYQTISRGIHYLAFRQAQKKRGFMYVDVPETYLLHIPGRPQELSDRNYVIIERYIEGLQRIDTISDVQDKEINIAVQEAHLFDYSKENMLAHGKDGVMIVDLEQPNNACPIEFFEKSRIKLARF